MTEKQDGFKKRRGRTARKRATVALVGQQNCGKSTLFNALTGLSQHVANYPGVTVDKKSAVVAFSDFDAEMIDLPGAYNLTSFSPEERVTRDYLLNGGVDVVVNVVDASNLRRGLHLTLQILEAGFPAFVVLNMVDVAKGLGQEVDAEALAHALGVPVIPAVARKGQGCELVKATIRRLVMASNHVFPLPLRIDYAGLEPAIAGIEAQLAAHSEACAPASPRWCAVKLLEGDPATVLAVQQRIADGAAIVQDAIRLGPSAPSEDDPTAADLIVDARSRRIDAIMADCVSRPGEHKVSVSEKLDRVLLNRWLAPFFLIATVWLIYEVSIVFGEDVSGFMWGLLAVARSALAKWLPAAGFLYDPELRSFGLWLADSVVTLLVYVPIFLILFTMIAVIEDSGYMARIAFILDRILHRFGLHGQSTLPFILAGVFAGGCAVPGVMATKGIPDNRARMATILTVPFMNCQAKIPLYVLLVNTYFAADKGWAMFFISTITVLFALLIAKLLTVTVLKGNETAPFVMDLPHYHAPTISGVLRRAVDRTWMYVKKVGTIVLAVAAVVYVLLQYPGLPEARQESFEARGNALVAAFYRDMAGNPYLHRVQDGDRLMDVLNIAFANGLVAPERQTEEGVLAATEADELAEKYPDLKPFLVGGEEADMASAHKAFMGLAEARRSLRMEMRQERITGSVLGRIGKSLEPVTRYAGFDWKINVTLLSSFAARENSVATLGVLFAQPDGGSQRLEERMAGGEGGGLSYPAMTALGLLLFFALYPPCLATMIMVKIQTNSYRWMLFAIFFPTALGLIVASGTVTLGTLLGLSAVETMIAFYALLWVLFLTVGLWPQRQQSNATPATRVTSHA